MAELFEEQSDSSEDEAKTRADKQLCYWKSRIRCSDADRSSASSSATCAGHRTHFANAATASLQRQTRGNEMDAQEMLELHLSQFRAATNVALTTEKHFEEYQRHLIAEIEHRMHEPSSHWANDDDNSLRSSGCTGTLLDTERTHSLTQLSSAASEPSFAWRCLQRVMRDMYSTDVVDTDGFVRMDVFDPVGQTPPRNGATWTWPDQMSPTVDASKNERRFRRHALG